jgi:hypothetical protein
MLKGLSIARAVLLVAMAFMITLLLVTLVYFAALLFSARPD